MQGMDGRLAQYQNNHKTAEFYSLREKQQVSQSANFDLNRPTFIAITQDGPDMHVRIAMQKTAGEYNGPSYTLLKLGEGS